MMSPRSSAKRERGFEMTKKARAKSKGKGAKKLKLQRSTLKDLDAKAARSVKGGARAQYSLLKTC